MRTLVVAAALTTGVVAQDAQPAPINVVIMIDASASLELMQEQIRISADRVIAQLGPGDRARIGTFSNEVVITPQGSSDRVALSRALNDSVSRRARAPTLLWDAMDLAMAAVASEPGRRVVLVFTDGEDTGSRRANFNRVVERAQADDVMIYAVGVTRLVLQKDPLRMLSVPPDARLRRLAEATGGGYVELTPTTELGATFARVADELRRKYP